MASALIGVRKPILVADNEENHRNVGEMTDECNNIQRQRGRRPPHNLHPNLHVSAHSAFFFASDALITLGKTRAKGSLKSWPMTPLYDTVEDSIHPLILSPPSISHANLGFHEIAHDWKW